MKKVVAFLLALIIFVAPVTTFVKADVVIGDNDETIMNENATILGRKLAMMESLSDLALSGVTEYTISNTEDVDTYLDYLWGELNNAIESLQDGTGFTEISDTLKSKYYTNLVQYKDYIDNRGQYLGLNLQNPTTSLLKTFFANNIYGKQYTQHYDLALDMFRSLSAYNSNTPSPQPSPDFSFISNINGLYIPNCNLMSFNGLFNQGGNYPTLQKPLNSVTLTANGFVSNKNHLPEATGAITIYVVNPICTINVTTSNSGVDVIYTSQSSDYLFTKNNNPSYQTNFRYIENNEVYITSVMLNDPNTPKYIQSHFDGLSSCMNYIYDHYCNINLYVDGVAWALVDVDSSTPTLDIDGLLKIFGNNQPQQYQLQPYTKIDYDELYTTIYNAIRDNLPISQSDITYYDSHDNIYSPTIINNYGEEEGDESDLIDTILDYAVIPKFDTAIAQPMRQALTNGVVIMQNSITNVIPNEILLILGACFFLLLFAVVINRMIK